MPTVRFGAVAGLLAQAAVLGALAWTVGLTPGGWLLGLACGWTVNATLARGLAATGGSELERRLGPANRITLARATLVGGVAALVFDAFFRRLTSGRLDALVALAAVALVLDAVDGFVARRTHTVTALGARFDMEIDAFLIFVLSCHVARSLGAWVLAIGLARYAFVAAGWLLPWLRRPAPPRHWCKTVAAIQGIVLTVAAARLLPVEWLIGLVVVALALLAESFGHDIGWLWHTSAQGGTGAGWRRAGSHRMSEPDVADRTEVDAVVVRPPRWSVRSMLVWAGTASALGLVWFAAVAPNRLDLLTPLAFLRIPIEGVVVVGVACWCCRPRRGAFWPRVVGGLLGLITVAKILDMGFFSVLDRPFNPVIDWGNFVPALGVLRDSIGSFWTGAAVVGAVVLIGSCWSSPPWPACAWPAWPPAIGLVSARAVIALGLVWALFAVIGVHIAPDAPVAATSAAGLVDEQTREVTGAIHDQKTFSSGLPPTTRSRHTSSATCSPGCGARTCSSFSSRATAGRRPGFGVLAAGRCSARTRAPSSCGRPDSLREAHS